jgi:hypothetical protein
MGGKKESTTDNTVFTDDVPLSEGHPEPQTWDRWARDCMKKRKDSHLEKTALPSEVFCFTARIHSLTG